MLGGTNNIGTSIQLAGHELGTGANNIAVALHESAVVGRDVAIGHKLIGKSIPEAGIWLGGAGICGMLHHSYIIYIIICKY